MKTEVLYDPVETKPVKLELKRDNLKDYKEILLSLSNDSHDEIEIHYLIHYLIPEDRIWLVNIVYNILKTGGKLIFKAPHWASSRQYGDLLVQWPPISESWFYHLNSQWRKENNHLEDRYTCDFDFTWGYGMHPLLINRNLEYQQHALVFWKESAQELIATGIKK